MARHVLISLASLVCVIAAKPRQEFKLEIPRVTTAELAANATLRSGLLPYVLTDHVGERWKASNWTLDYLVKKIPFEWVDFYDKNMLDQDQKPYLYRFNEALPRFEEKTGVPRYMQLRLSLRGWKRLKKDLHPLPLTDLFWSDEEWISKCMSKNGKVDEDAINNFYVTQQWKFLLIGEAGTSMFFHKDGTASSSWQTMLMGKKRWTLCPNDQSQYLDARMKTFDPEALEDPRFAKAYCGQTTVGPGDLLYYPGYWWHHTLQTETPSVAYTGALIGTESDRDDIAPYKSAHSSFLRDMKRKCQKCWHTGHPERKCDDISEKWPGAAPPELRVLCDEYFDRCCKLWDEHAVFVKCFEKAR